MMRRQKREYFQEAKWHLLTFRIPFRQHLMLLQLSQAYFCNVIAS